LHLKIGTILIQLGIGFNWQSVWGLIRIGNLLAPEPLCPGELEHPEAGSGWLEEEEEEGSVGSVEESCLAHLVREHVQSILRPLTLGHFEK